MEENECQVSDGPRPPARPRALAQDQQRSLIWKGTSVPVPLCSYMQGASQPDHYLIGLTGIGMTTGEEKLTVQVSCYLSGCFTSLQAISLYIDYLLVIL